MFAYRLVAHGIGGRTVEELEASMDVEEFMTWMAYSSIEPFPEQRADVHTALLLAQQYNMNRPQGKPAKKPKHFLPKWYDEERPPQTVEEMKRVMQLQIMAMGGKLN